MQSNRKQLKYYTKINGSTTKLMVQKLKYN